MEEEFDEIEKLQHQGINAGDIKVRSQKTPRNDVDLLRLDGSFPRSSLRALSASLPRLSSRVITRSRMQKLKEAGIHTIQGLQHLPKRVGFKMHRIFEAYIG
jgi:hypothetical protein